MSDRQRCFRDIVVFYVIAELFLSVGDCAAEIVFFYWFILNGDSEYGVSFWNPIVDMGCIWERRGVKDIVELKNAVAGTRLALKCLMSLRSTYLAVDNLVISKAPRVEFSVSEESREAGAACIRNTHRTSSRNTVNNMLQAIDSGHRSPIKA